MSLPAGHATPVAANPIALKQLTTSVNYTLEKQLLLIMHEIETSLEYWHAMEDSPFSYTIIRGPKGWVSNISSQELIQTHITVLKEKQTEVAQALGTIARWPLEHTDAYSAICLALPNTLLNQPITLEADGHTEQLLAHGIQLSGSLPTFYKDYIATISNHVQPNHLTRNWAKYAVGTACVAAACWFVRTNQDKIEAWKHNGHEAVINFWTKHIQLPLKNSKDILFGRKHLKVISPEAVMGSEATFAKRLNELLPIIKPNASKEELETIRSYILETKDSSLLVEFWGNQTKNLVWNYVTNPISGKLHFLEASSALIQLKDWQLNQATLAGQQQWEAQQLNAEILAIFPVVLALYGAKKGYDALFHGKIVSEPLQHRLLLVDKLLNKYNVPEHTFPLEAVGYLNYHIHALAQYLKLIPSAQQKSFNADLLELHNPELSVTQKLRVIDQMHRTYAFLSPLAV